MLRQHEQAEFGISTGCHRQDAVPGSRAVQVPRVSGDDMSTVYSATTSSGGGHVLS